ncbi:MAG: helix-turn-helix transcriptional regulator [Deltaproteobacteria bacterium]|nr:helix-turn-helix transcriptional regulator [Deltaproteobacteria bacterium]
MTFKPEARYLHFVADIRYAQFCPLTRAVEILGERWTLLLLRELVAGPQRFSDLKDRLPGVSSSVLAGRLARLEEKGLIARRELPAPAASTVYELAEAGRALRPVMVELIRWGMRFLGAPCAEERFEPRWMLMGLQAFARRQPTPPCSLRIVIAAKPADVEIYVAGGPGGTEVSALPRAVQACVRAQGFDLLLLANGLIDIGEAIASDRIRVEGDASIVAALPELFDFRPVPEAVPESPSNAARDPASTEETTLENISRNQTQGATN